MAAIATVLAFAGVVLVILDILLQIAILILDATKKPPHTLVETWINNQTTNNQSFLNSLITAPSQVMKHTLPSTVSRNSDGTVVSWSIKNTSAIPNTISMTRLYFQTGEAPATFTTESTYVLTPPNTQFKVGFVRNNNFSKLTVVVNPTSSQQNVNGKWIYQESLVVSGVHDPKTNSNSNITLAGVKR